ncbi:unnamed protein product [Arabidopsis halleri]
MDESDIKGLKLLELNDSDANRGPISVEGYDTSLHADFESGTLKRVAFMRIEGEDANEKALELSGTDVGGWTVIVKAAPWQKEVMDPWCPASAAAARPKEHSLNVTGYDTSLPEIDIEMAVCEFLSSCGEVARVMVLPSCACVSLLGEGCVEKAMNLSGCNVGGMSLVVSPVVLVKRNRSTNKTGYMPPGSRTNVSDFMTPSHKKKIEMEKKKQKMEMEK